MKTKGKVILTAVIFATLGLAGGLALLTNGFKEFDRFGITEVVDNSRVAITIDGTKDEQLVHAYFYFDHEEFENTFEPFKWPGISPKEDVKKSYITYNEKDSYTIEFENLLPPKYQDFNKFLETGGTCGVVISYGDEESRIQSADYMVIESGNHHLSLPNQNGDKLTSKIIKFTKLGIKDTEEKE